MTRRQPQEHSTASSPLPSASLSHACKDKNSCESLRAELAATNGPAYALLQDFLSKALVGQSETLGGYCNSGIYLPDMEVLLNERVVGEQNAITIQEGNKTGTIRFVSAAQGAHHQIGVFATTTTTTRDADGAVVSVVNLDMNANVSLTGHIKVYNTNRDRPWGLALCTAMMRQIVSVLPPQVAGNPVLRISECRGTFNSLIGSQHSKAAFWKSDALRAHLPGAEFNKPNHSLKFKTPETHKGCLQLFSSGSLGVMGGDKPCGEIVMRYLPDILSAVFCVSGLASNIDQAMQVLSQAIHDPTKVRRNKLSRAKQAALEAKKSGVSPQSLGGDGDKKPTGAGRAKQSKGSKKRAAFSSDEEEEDADMSDVSDSVDESDGNIPATKSRASARIAQRKITNPGFGRYNSSSSDDNDHEETGKKRRYADSEDEEEMFVPPKKAAAKFSLTAASVPIRTPPPGLVLAPPTVPQMAPFSSSVGGYGACMQQQQQQAQRLPQHPDFVGSSEESGVNANSSSDFIVGSSEESNHAEEQQQLAQPLPQSQPQSQSQPQPQPAGDIDSGNLTEEEALDIFHVRVEMSPLAQPPCFDRVIEFLRKSSNDSYDEMDTNDNDVLMEKKYIESIDAVADDDDDAQSFFPRYRGADSMSLSQYSLQDEDTFVDDAVLLEEMPYWF